MSQQVRSGAAMDELEAARAGWLDLVVEVLGSSTPRMPWERIGRELGHQLRAALAGRFHWDTDGLVSVDASPFPDWFDLPDLASRAPSRHPLARHYATARSWEPRSTFQVSFDGDELTREYGVELTAVGIAEQLWIPVSLGAREWMVVGACRDEEPYGRRALELARLGQQVVTALHRHCATLSAGPGPAPRGVRPGAAVDLGLTPRQVVVLTLVAEGLTAVAIGHRLHVSSRTVEQHLHHIYERLRVHDRASAVRRACLAGLIQEPESEFQISAALALSNVNASSSSGLVR